MRWRWALNPWRFIPKPIRAFDAGIDAVSASYPECDRRSRFGTPIIAVALVLIRMVYVEGMWTPAPKPRPIQNRVDAEAPPCGERYRNIPQRLALPRIAGTRAGIRLGSNGRHEQLKRE